MKTEKYPSELKFIRTRLLRSGLRAMIRNLTRWQPLTDPKSGYTVIIGAQAALHKLVHVNLQFVAQQNCPNLCELIVVFDCPKENMPEPVEEQLRRAFPQLPLKFLYYTPLQTRRLAKINWGWCYSWLSWSTGIGATQTRYALLHDLDAMLLDTDLLEMQYRTITERNDQYVGVKFYNGNGIVPDDGLVATFELIFDAQYVRQHFKPIDLFNHVARYNGRRVEFDTFLYAQSQHGGKSITEIRGEQMVHPSQLICQVTDLRRKQNYLAPAQNNLPLLPYFFHLAGDLHALNEHRAAFDQASGSRLGFLGHTMDAARLTSSHVDWLEVQVHRLENATCGSVRPEIRAYFHSMRQFIERNRTSQHGEAAA